MQKVNNFCDLSEGKQHQTCLPVLSKLSTYLSCRMNLYLVVDIVDDGHYKTLCEFSFWGTFINCDTYGHCLIC